ncbi:MAG: hypothetical protein JWQ09_5886 [Segetibacter sp.]|nr:hypothetical protein [Segetibacter sp.]
MENTDNITPEETPTPEITDAPATIADQAKVEESISEVVPPEEDKEESFDIDKCDAEFKSDKLVVKIKLTEDVLFLNPDLRSLGYRAGDIVEFTPAETE